MSALDEPWLSVQQTARRSARHPDTVRRALECGELHGHQRRRNGRWQVHVAAVDGWIRGEQDRALAEACGCRYQLRPVS